MTMPSFLSGAHRSGEGPRALPARGSAGERRRRFAREPERRRCDGTRPEVAPALARAAVVRLTEPLDRPGRSPSVHRGHTAEAPRAKGALMAHATLDTDRLDHFIHTVVEDLGAALSAALVRIGDKLGLY